MLWPVCTLTQTPHTQRCCWDSTRFADSKKEKTFHHLPSLLHSYPNKMIKSLIQYNLKQCKQNEVLYTCVYITCKHSLLTSIPDVITFLVNPEQYLITKWIEEYIFLYRVRLQNIQIEEKISKGMLYICYVYLVVSKSDPYCTRGFLTPVSTEAQ